MSCRRYDWIKHQGEWRALPAVVVLPQFSDHFRRQMPIPTRARRRVGSPRHATPRDALQLPGPRALDRTGERRTHTHHTDARTLTSGRCCHGDQDSRAGSGRTKNSRDDEAQLRPESKLFFIYLPEEVAVPDRIQDAWREEEPCMEGGGASYRRLKPQLSLSALAGWPPSPSVPNPTPAGTTLPSGQVRAGPSLDNRHGGWTTPTTSPGPSATLDCIFRVRDAPPFSPVKPCRHHHHIKRSSAKDDGETNSSAIVTNLASLNNRVRVCGPASARCTERAPRHVGYTLCPLGPCRTAGAQQRTRGRGRQRGARAGGRARPATTHDMT